MLRDVLPGHRSCTTLGARYLGRRKVGEGPKSILNVVQNERRRPRR